MELQRLPISPTRCELFARASEYVARGWSVLPLRGKISAIPWQEFQARRPSPLELSDWFFESRTPPTGIGIVTGRVSQLVVVDCDSPADAAFWTSQFPDSPLAVGTGGGGGPFHDAFPTGENVRNRVRVLGRRIDIRGDGGYVVAPPSLHRSGRHYAWQAYDAAAALPRFSPAWLAHGPRVGQTPARTHMGKVRNAVAYIQRICAVAGEGGHNATFRAACKLRDAGLAPDEALAVLGDWNETNARPPWSAAELEHKISSAYGSLHQ
ncbi:MAG TPA: bifunctional DNA primase/polymerase [Lacipirellulaceae bacterium]|nr:bifunctional DNA primase/polymerase [Lacipirellulaceae bacterium]